MTTNLQLETIEMNDTIKDSFVRKMNSNNVKLDNAYGYLKEHLLENTGKDNLNDAIEYVTTMGETITELENEIVGLESIGNASASEIMNGKTALVQGEEITGTGFSTTTTASAEDIANGKTAYANNGTLLTGTFVPSTFGEKTITGDTGSQSVTFTFDEDITNKRIIFYAKPTNSYLRCSSSVQYLMFADSETNTFGTLYHSSTSNTISYYYDRNTYYTITKSGKNVTITGSSSSYLIGGYSTSYKADLYCLAM